MRSLKQSVKVLAVALVTTTVLSGCAVLAIPPLVGAIGAVGSAYALDSQMTGGTKCATSQGFFGSAKNLIMNGDRCKK